MAELVDALDLKSNGHSNARVGSSPTAGTVKSSGYCINGAFLFARGIFLCLVPLLILVDKMTAAPVFIKRPGWRIVDRFTGRCYGVVGKGGMSGRLFIWIFLTLFLTDVLLKPGPLAFYAFQGWFWEFHTWPIAQHTYV